MTASNTKQAGHKKDTIRALLILCLLFLASPGFSQPETEAVIAWESLTETQQRMLSRFQDDWETMDAQQQQRMLRRAERWRNMPPEQRDRIRRRGRELSGFERGRRERIRDNFEAFANMSEEEKRELRQSFERFRNLPEQERREIIEQYRRRGGPDGRGRDQERVRPPLSPPAPPGERLDQETDTE